MGPAVQHIGAICVCGFSRGMFWEKSANNHEKQQARKSSRRACLFFFFFGGGGGSWGYLHFWRGLQNPRGTPRETKTTNPDPRRMFPLKFAHWNFPGLSASNYPFGYFPLGLSPFEFSPLNSPVGIVPLEFSHRNSRVGIYPLQVSLWNCSLYSTLCSCAPGLSFCNAGDVALDAKEMLGMCDSYYVAVPPSYERV